MALLPISKFPMALGMMDVAMKISKQERLQRKKYMGLQRSLSGRTRAMISKFPTKITRYEARRGTAIRRC